MNEFTQRRLAKMGPLEKQAEIMRMLKPLQLRLMELQTSLLAVLNADMTSEEKVFASDGLIEEADAIVAKVDDIRTLVG